jgi:hypothetical protein
MRASEAIGEAGITHHNYVSKLTSKAVATAKNLKIDNGDIRETQQTRQHYCSNANRSDEDACHYGTIGQLYCHRALLHLLDTNHFVVFCLIQEKIQRYWYQQIRIRVGQELQNRRGICYCCNRT